MLPTSSTMPQPLVVQPYQPDIITIFCMKYFCSDHLCHGSHSTSPPHLESWGPILIAVKACFALLCAHLFILHICSCIVVCLCICIFHIRILYKQSTSSSGWSHGSPILIEVCAHLFVFLYLFLFVYVICVFCAFVFLCICILHISITSAPTYLLIWSHKGPILIALHPPRASLYFHMQWQNRSWRRPAEEVKAYFCLRNISVFVYFVFLYLCISYFFPPDEMEDGGIQLGQ